MTSTRIFILFALVIICHGCKSNNGNHLTTDFIDQSPTGSAAYHGLIQYRAQDAKEAITEPVFIPANKALLAAGTKVIGIFINGEARAYPLLILNNHQVVNDVIGGTPVSATW